MSNQKEINVAKSTSFVLKMSEEFPVSEFMVKSFFGLGIDATFPELNFNNIATQYLPGKTRFNNMNATIILDEKLEILEEMQKYMVDMSNPNDGSIRNKEFDAILYMYSNKNKLIKKIQFKNCSLRSISDINLDTNEEAPILITITIQFNLYEFID